MQKDAAILATAIAGIADAISSYSKLRPLWDGDIRPEYFLTVHVAKGLRAVSWEDKDLYLSVQMERRCIESLLFAVKNRKKLLSFFNRDNKYDVTCSVDEHEPASLVVEIKNRIQYFSHLGQDPERLCWSVEAAAGNVQGLSCFYVYKSGLEEDAENNCNKTIEQIKMKFKKIANKYNVKLKIRIGDKIVIGDHSVRFSALAQELKATLINDGFSEGRIDQFINDEYSEEDSFKDSPAIAMPVAIIVNS